MSGPTQAQPRTPRPVRDYTDNMSWVLWFSCRGADGNSVVSWHNQGVACLVAEGAPASQSGPAAAIDAGIDLVVSVQMSPCEDCLEDVFVACTAELEGDQLVVSSDASGRRAASDCGTACVDLNTTCPVVGLAAGTYTLFHGPDLLTFEVPSVGPLCVGAYSDPVTGP